MRKTVGIALSLLALAFFAPGGASAVVLTNTGLNDAEFNAFAGLPILGSVASSPYTVGTTTGTIDSAAYSGAGIAGGLAVCTYRLTVNSGTNADGFSVPFAAIVSSLNLGGSSAVDSSFHIVGALGGTSVLAGFYTSNGIVAPTTAFTDPSGNFHANFGTGFNGSASQIFGLLSKLPPGVVLATVFNHGSQSQAPSAVSPVPEPATLLLLGSGLSGLAAWGWRRRKV